MIRGYADSAIALQFTVSDQELVSRIKDSLQWPNPDFAKREHMGKSTYGCPRDIVLWQKRGTEILVPFGMLQPLAKSGILVRPTDHLVSHERVFSGEVEGLYSYQKEALEAALKAKNGVLVAPCGSGKTQIGIAICASLGLRTLWLTHTQELLKQSMERAKRYLDVPMGTITAGKVNAGSCLTFATVQTMSKIDLTPFKEFWDVIIVDECHRCTGTPTQVTMFWKVLSSLSARYKIGLTATPKRADNMERAMYALLGPKFFEIAREQVKATTCPLTVAEPIPTEWMPDFDKVLNPDGTLNYTNLITNCIEDEHRNLVVSDIIDFAAADGPVLVLSERVAHLETLQKMCKYPSGNLSSAKKSDRKDLIGGLASGTIKVLFATYAIAKEGLDIPCLKHLVIASPIKDEIAVTQSAGRVMRAYPEKTEGMIWEFEDGMQMLQKWMRKRLSIYNKINGGNT